jgi:3-oxoacyl-[acyl-carrier-protein] synthase II
MLMHLCEQGSTGHSLGAAGGFEAVACVMAIQTGIVPPTINYVTPDPKCDLDYTPNKVFRLGYLFRL